MRIRRPLKKEDQVDEIEEDEEEFDEEEHITPPVAYFHIVRDKARPTHESKELPPLIKYPGYLNRKETSPWYREAIWYLKAFLAEGFSRAEIMERMGIEDDRVFDKLEYRLMETDGAKFIEMGTAHRFYVHTLRMEQLVRELDQYTRTHMEDGARSSKIVSAVKAKAQIYKDLISMGQDLGIIEKRAKELRVLGDLNLGALPTEELKELFQQRIEWFNEVMGQPKELPSAYDNILTKSVEQVENEDVIDADYEVAAEESPST